MKELLASLSAVAVLAAGGLAMVGLTSGTASAQEDTVTTDDAAVDEQRPDRRDGRRGRGLATAAGVIGIDTADLAAALADGSTVAEVAVANGSTAEAVVEAIVANASQRIDDAVADGRLTADEGSSRLTRITSRVTDMVNGDFERPDRGERSDGERRSRIGAGARGLDTAADTIGIPIADLIAAVRDGSSIADVAAANGSSGDAVIAAMVANASERIDQAVADGEMTAEEGAGTLATVTERITKRVNTTHDFSNRPGPRGSRSARGADVVDA